MESEGRGKREGERAREWGTGPHPLAPNTQHPTPKLAVVADDLTGALDTGVQFARHGLETLVLLQGDEIPEAEVVVLTTDSRDEPAEEAYRCAEAAGRAVRGRFVYKKIDSTLRGNLGAEIDGLLDGLGIDRALVAPSFPATGRTTVGGITW